MKFQVGDKVKFKKYPEQGVYKVNEICEDDSVWVTDIASEKEKLFDYDSELEFHFDKGDRISLEGCDAVLTFIEVNNFNSDLACVENKSGASSSVRLDKISPYRGSQDYDLTNVAKIVYEKIKSHTSVEQDSKNALGGVKNDQGKLRYTLLLEDLPRAVKEVVKVLEVGAKKYDRKNFELVETDRYKDAILRHLCDGYLKGEVKDPETNLHHLAHLVCNALFILERELKEES